MSALWLVVRKEWRCLAGGERGMFVLYGVILLLWSVLFVATSVNENPLTVTMWLLPFSVIVVSNFAQGVFVAERINGAIEVLLTCGLSRRSIILGKVVFVVAVSMLMGLACMALSWLWVWLLGDLGPRRLAPELLLQYAAIFFSAVLLNASMAALLSLWLPNPRMSHFVNFLVIALVLGAYYPLATLLPVPMLLLSGLLCVSGVLICIGALRLARGERIARTVTV